MRRAVGGRASSRLGLRRFGGPLVELLGVTTRRSKYILWWSRPQNSEHTPPAGHSPVISAMSTSTVETWSGNMSRLNRKPGIQKECTTSTDVTSKRTVDDVGSTSSGTSCSEPLTTTPRSGYSKRHCQRNPVTSTSQVDVVVIGHGVDGAHREQRDEEQHDDDHQRDDGVGQLDGDVEAHLRWEAVVAAAVPHHAPHDEHGDEEEHGDGAVEEERPDLVDLLGLLGERVGQHRGGDHSPPVPAGSFTSSTSSSGVSVRSPSLSWAVSPTPW